MSRLLSRMRKKARHLLGLEIAPYDPVSTVQAEGNGVWYWACVYAWATMMAALASCSMFISDPWLTAQIGLLLVTAFPVAYYVHYTRVSRTTMNYIVFFAAIGLGAVQFGPTIVVFGQRPPEDVFVAVRLLIIAFLWIMVFRAFAMRTVTELVQTILPAGSIVLLSLVVIQHYTALVGMALLIWGTLALLALERRLAIQNTGAEVRGLQLSRARQWSGTLYSWPALYALALVVAVGVGYYTARAELSSDSIERMRMYLARSLARHFLVPDYAPPAALWLPSIQPPEGRQIIMEVRSERPTNWRTTSYDTYTDRTWARRLPRKAATLSLEDDSWLIGLEQSGLSRDAVPTQAEITPHVDFRAALATPFFPVRFSVDADMDVLFHTTDGTISSLRRATVGRTYTVDALMPPILPIGGVAHPPTREQLESCLQLPPSLSPRVEQLARTLTAEVPSEFEKVRAIELHLAYNYAYDLQVPPPWRQELVEQFLFHTKRGYCYHFATAMTIMCRTIGLPARMAVGFTQGETREAEDDLYVVRAEDAHAWPEVYLRGGGWMAFEPTPAAREDEPRTFADVWEDAMGAVKAQVRTTVLAVLRQWPNVAALLVLAIVVVGVSRTYLEWSRHRPPVHANARDQIVWAYRRMRSLLGSHGAPDRPEVAATEFVEALPRPLQHLREPVDRISKQYLVARFGPRSLADSEAEKTLEALQLLRHRLRQKPRV